MTFGSEFDACHVFMGGFGPTCLKIEGSESDKFMTSQKPISDSPLIGNAAGNAFCKSSRNVYVKIQMCIYAIMWIAH